MAPAAEEGQPATHRITHAVLDRDAIQRRDGLRVQRATHVQLHLEPAGLSNTA